MPVSGDAEDEIGLGRIRMTCETFRELLPLALYGEVSFEEEEQLDEHAMTCESCAEDRERLTQIIRSVGSEPAGVPPGLLSRCRRDLSARLTADGSTRRQPAWWERALAALNPSLSWIKPASALALLSIGFLGGRLMPDWGSSGSGSIDPASVSRVRYVDSDIPGRVRLVVDETRQRELTGEVSDAGIRRILMGALGDPSDPGLRAESVDLLGSSSDNADVRQALVNSLRSDPNSGVRLKALEGLRRYAAESEIRDALCEVLLTDDNPAIRAQAIDMLVQHKDTEIAGVLQELVRKEENSYIRSQSLKALSEMKASAGTF